MAAGHEDAGRGLRHAIGHGDLDRLAQHEARIGDDRLVAMGFAFVVAEHDATDLGRRLDLRGLNDLV